MQIHIMDVTTQRLEIPLLEKNSIAYGENTAKNNHLRVSFWLPILKPKTSTYYRFMLLMSKLVFLQTNFYFYSLFVEMFKLYLFFFLRPEYLISFASKSFKKFLNSFIYIYWLTFIPILYFNAHQVIKVGNFEIE